MKRQTLNAVLVVLVGGLGVGVWFSQEKEEKGPPITTHTADTLTKIVIEHPGSDAIRLEKQGGNWRLVAPSQAAVDVLEINALLGLADREARQTLEVGSIKLAELGLDPPEYTISLNGTKIAFGGTEPLNYRRYVKVGSTVSLIDDPPSAALDEDYHDLVSKKLFADEANIERIEVPDLTLSKDSEGGWQLQPANDKATTDRMQKLADGWTSAMAMWNEMPVDKNPKGEPIKITLKGGAEHSFVLLERDPQFKLYSATAGVNYVLSKALTEMLLQLPVIPEPEPEVAPEPEPPAETES